MARYTIEEYVRWEDIDAAGIINYQAYLRFFGLAEAELRQLTEGIRFIEKMNAHLVNKDGVSRELGPLRKLFSKSIVARARIPAGTLLTEDHLALKKPGTGLPPARLSSLVGRRTLRTLEQDELVADDDIESKGAK